MIGGRTEFIGELIQVGGQHHVAFRVSQYQHQTKHFKAEEKQQHAGIENRRTYHRQADRGHHLQRRCPYRPRRLFDIRTDATQRGGDIEIGMRDVSQPGNHHNAEHGIDIPRHNPQQLLCPLREKPDRSGGDHITKSQYHRRNKNRHQNQRFNKPSPGQISTHH